MSCFEVKLRIQLMFESLSPSGVEKTKADINPHLLVCESCRNFLKAKLEEKKKELDK